MAHAILAPSGFEALMLCAGKPAMERGKPDQATQYSYEGTCAHFLAEQCLLLGADAQDFSGQWISILADDSVVLANRPEGQWRQVVDDSMAEYVQIFVNATRDAAEALRKSGATNVSLTPETQVPIDHITGEVGATGTSDAIVVGHFPDYIAVEVWDLKYGRGVEVSPDDNAQLKLYALGTIRKLGLHKLSKPIEVTLVIHQPRVAHAPKRWVSGLELLSQWADDHATPAALRAWELYQNGATLKDLNPHPDACRFCKARGECPALDNHVQETIAAEFTDLTTADAEAKVELVRNLAEGIPLADLPARMDAVELVEDWCKAVRARVEGLLLSGQPVGGYKLVKGRSGARVWRDEVEAEALLKKLRLKKDEMYAFKLISPTAAEKLLKATPKRWERVCELIEKSEGKPSVARADDPRPAVEIAPVEAEFTAIADTVEDLV